MYIYDQISNFYIQDLIKRACFEVPCTTYLFSIHLIANNRASLACAARLADTLCPHEFALWAPRLPSLTVECREVTLCDQY